MAETHYPTMSIEEITALPVDRLALPDCELWFWSTNSFIHEALHIIEAWGFAYKTKRTWIKRRQGTGVWLRGQTEDLLIAIRGRPRRPILDAGRRQKRITPSSFIVSRAVLPHSRKPRESYEDIERVSGEPRLELFARRARAGWDSWGYEAKELDLDLADDINEHVRRRR